MGGPGSWTHAPLPEFLFALPYLFRIDGDQPIPPLAVLNQVLGTGSWDAGMSGACEWKPFEMSKAEYDARVEELLTHPERSFVRDEALESIESVDEWREKALRKYVLRKR